MKGFVTGQNKRRRAGQRVTGPWGSGLQGSQARGEPDENQTNQAVAKFSQLLAGFDVAGDKRAGEDQKLI